MKISFLAPSFLHETLLYTLVVSLVIERTDSVTEKKIVTV